MSLRTLVTRVSKENDGQGGGGGGGKVGGGEVAIPNLKPLFAQLLSGTNSFSIFLGVAAPLKMVFPKKGSTFSSRVTEQLSLI